MEKKKKKILISVIVIVLVAVIATIGIVFAVQNSKNNSNSENAENVSKVSLVTNTYNEAIAKGLVSENYTGNYIYSGIVSIDFVFYDQEKDAEYTDEEKQYYISVLYQNKNVKNGNEFYNLLSNQKSELYKDNILVFIDGRYTRVILNDDETYDVLETGTYVGDDNLTQVTINEEDENVFYASLNYARPDDAISISMSYQIDATTLYVYENVTSATNPSLVLFTITYAYELTEFNINAIPDAELNF